MLQLDVAITSEVAAGRYDSFRVSLPPSESIFTLRLALTALTGRLSVFAACHAAPNATHHQWAADSAPDSPLHALLDVSSAEAQDEGCAGGTFYVSVFGGAAGGAFSLLASLPSDLGSAPLLLPGVPATGQTSFRQFRYFYVRPGQAFEGILLGAACPQGGNVDLYVGTSFEARPTVDEATGNVSSFVAGDAIPGASSESLSLSSGFVQSLCAGRPACYLVVGVLGTGGRPRDGQPMQPFSFTLMAALQDGTARLQDGVPQRGWVARHSFAYYSFPVSQPQTDVTVSVTAAGEGDPDIYVGLGFHPSRSNFTFSSSTFGQDTLTVQWGDLQQRGCSPDPSLGRVCRLFVGVYGWTNVSFSVVATHDAGFAAPTLLLDGQVTLTLTLPLILILTLSLTLTPRCWWTARHNQARWQPLAIATTSSLLRPTRRAGTRWRFPRVWP